MGTYTTLLSGVSNLYYTAPAQNLWQPVWNGCERLSLCRFAVHKSVGYFLANSSVCVGYFLASSKKSVGYATIYS